MFHDAKDILVVTFKVATDEFAASVSPCRLMQNCVGLGCLVVSSSNCGCESPGARAIPKSHESYAPRSSGTAPLDWPPNWPFLSRSWLRAQLDIGRSGVGGPWQARCQRPSRRPHACARPRKLCVHVSNLPEATKVAKNCPTKEFVACAVVLSLWMTRCRGISRPSLSAISATRFNVCERTSRKWLAP